MTYATAARAVALALTLLPSTTIAAQQTAHLPPLLPEQREIGLALSAGPSHVASGAAVYVLRRGGYTKVRDGSSGYSCLVERDHPRSLAPICYDSEASVSILPGALRLAELREAGFSYGEARDSVLAMYRSGRLPVPRRPAMSYMLSAEQELYAAPDGPRVGAWHPHVMIYSPFLTNEQIGALPGDPSQPFVAEEGTPISHIVVITREWSRPQPAGTSHSR